VLFFLLQLIPSEIIQPHCIIASGEAIQKCTAVILSGLLRRFAARNDAAGSELKGTRHNLAPTEENYLNTKGTKKLLIHGFCIFVPLCLQKKPFADAQNHTMCSINKNIRFIIRSLVRVVGWEVL
jgi:hypothetical protein